MSKLHISSDGAPPVQYDESKVQLMLQQGHLREDALYWKEGMQDWKPLRDLFPASPYAPPAANPVPPPLAPSRDGYAFTKDPRGLTKVLKVMLWANLAVVILSLLSDLGQWRLVSGGDITMEAAEANDSRQGLVGMLYLGVFIATAITFGMWIHRANVNCRGFGANGMKFTPGWSVGYYFIPILNLFRPYQAMKEIWQVSSNPRNWQVERGPGLLAGWWTLWVVSNFLGQAVFRTSRAADTPSELEAATILSMVAAFEDVLLILAAIALVSKIIAMQVRLTETSA